MHPRLFHFGSVIVPTYGAIAALGLVLALLFSLRCARYAGVAPDNLWNLGLFTAFGTLLLSRAVLIAQVPRAFTTYPMLVLTLPTVTRFGLLLAVLSGGVYVYAKRMPWLSTLDAIAPPICLLSGFLHLGSVFAGDDLGTATTSSLGHLIPGDDGHHPVALYASAAAFLIATVSVALLRSQSSPGETFGAALALGAAAHFLVDEVRPLYLLPSTAYDSVLRMDQFGLLTLVVAGGLLLLRRKGAYAK